MGLAAGEGDFRAQLVRAQHELEAQKAANEAMAAELKGHIDDAKALMGVNNELRHQLRAEKQLREEAEERLAERSRPSSATTIGKVHVV